jgi:hypothetical protein
MTAAMGGFFLPDNVAAAVLREGVLRALRKWRGYRQLDLSLRSGVSLAKIIAHESESADLEADERKRLAAVLRVPVEVIPVREPRLHIVPKDDSPRR